MRDCLVLVPYFDSPEGLLLALNSIEDYQNRLSVLVVDDGSHLYPAAQVVKPVLGSMPTEVLRLSKNSGIEHALNHGLRARGSRYKYIARLDCGDECTPDRFRLQLEYLDRNEDLMLLGGAARFLSGDSSYIYKAPTRASDVRRHMKVNSAFVHPAVIFRSEILEEIGYYPLDRPAAEDYAYFRKISERYRSENLPDVVINAFIDPKGISTVKRRRQVLSRIQIMFDHFDWSLLATWGILRSAVLLMTPRRFTAKLRSVIQPTEMGAETR